MAELLYLADSYLKEFDANVIDSRECCVILDRTAFYPRGGGQPSDRGWLFYDEAELGVEEVFKKGGEVYHRLEKGFIPIGSRVRGLLDWDLRYACMRHHTALHILSGVVFHLYGGLVTGGQIHHNRARLDFDLEELNRDRVKMIEDRANEVIREARAVKTRILPREEAFKIPDLIRTKINLLPPQIRDVRVVEIEGFDQQADGGTHVKNTLEVGRVRVSRVENKGRMNRRIEIVLE